MKVDDLVNRIALKVSQSKEFHQNTQQLQEFLDKFKEPLEPPHKEPLEPPHKEPLEPPHKEPLEPPHKEPLEPPHIKSSEGTSISNFPIGYDGASKDTSLSQFQTSTEVSDNSKISKIISPSDDASDKYEEILSKLDEVLEASKSESSREEVKIISNEDEERSKRFDNFIKDAEIRRENEAAALKSKGALDNSTKDLEESSEDLDKQDKDEKSQSNEVSNNERINKKKSLIGAIGGGTPLGVVSFITSRIGSKISGAVSDAFNSVKKALSNAFNSLKKGAKLLWDKLPIVLSLIYLFFFSQVPTILKNAFNEYFAPYLSDIWNDLSSKEPFKTILQKLQELYDFCKDDLYNLVQRVVASIRDTVEWWNDDDDKRAEKGSNILKNIVKETGGQSYKENTFLTRFNKVDTGKLEKVIKDYYANPDEDAIKEKYKLNDKSWEVVKRVLDTDFTNNNKLSHSYINELREQNSNMSSEAFSKLLNAHAILSLTQDESFDSVEDNKEATPIAASSYIRNLAGYDDVVNVETSEGVKSLKTSEFITDAAGILAKSNAVHSNGMLNNVTSSELQDIVVKGMEEQGKKVTDTNDIDLKDMLRDLKKAITDMREKGSTATVENITNHYNTVIRRQ